MRDVIIKKKSRKKFSAIAKVGQNHFVKYRTNDLDKFIIFILVKFPGTLYVNFFINKGFDKGKLINTWGRNKGLVPAY